METSGDGRSEPEPESLVNYLRGRFGEELRSCVVYDESESEVLYLRDDIDREAARSRVTRIRSLSEGERTARDPDPDDPEFGRLYASTHVFGGALVVHLPADSGTVVGFSLDHAIGGRLTGFVRDCIEALYDRRS